MKDALARLENEKGTLHLLLNVLNRKLMADVIRVVKNTEQMAGKNNHVLKSLELKVTRVLKDAMGQSHTTSSTISLDSICSQADIERMLTNSGSTLNLTLTDMSDDSASILVIPDSLSLVDYASARIKFPIKSTKDEPKNVAAHIDLQDDIDGPMNSSLPSVTSVEALGTDEVDGTTVSSRLSLDDNDDNISSTSKRTDGGSVTPLAKTTAQQIIEYLHLDKSPLNSYGRKRMPGSRLPDCGKVSNPLSTTALKAFDDLINIAETLPTSLTEDLYRARRRLQLYSPVVQFLIMSGRGIENEYIVGCGQEVVKALKTYVGAVDTYMKALGKLYGNKTDWPQLTLSLITSSEGLDELWVSVERSMDDLEKAINMVLQLEVLQKTERVSQESDNED